MIKPYYQDSAVTIYHGDNREILPTLGKFDLLLTDPPYGIGLDRGVGDCGYDGFGNNKKRNPKRYKGSWDKERPTSDLFNLIIASSEKAIIWGGNYFSDILPKSSKWLFWDKQQTMPTYSDGEIAWTSLNGNSTKRIIIPQNGMVAGEQERFHPTQKPLALMIWCIQLAGDVQTIIDPFAGSGTTGRAAKDLGRKCVLIEREECYCEIAAKRMLQEVFDLGGV